MINKFADFSKEIKVRDRPQAVVGDFFVVKGQKVALAPNFCKCRFTGERTMAFRPMANCGEGALDPIASIILPIHSSLSSFHASRISCFR